MNAAAPSTSRPARARSALPQLNRPLLVVTVVMAVLTLVCLVGYFADPQEITGAPAWAKPLKFSISIGIYALTALWLFRFIPERFRRLGTALAWIISVALLIEQAIIVNAVILGTTSHFNGTTPLAMVLWQVMGASIVFVWVATLILAVVLWNAELGDRARKLAVRSGVVFALLGMVLAFAMVVPAYPWLNTGSPDVLGAHSVGRPDGGPGLPLLGWSTVTGDFRPAHFLGMHGLQAIPLIAWGLEAASRKSPALRIVGVRIALIWAANVAWFGFTILLFVQALRAQPVTAPDGVTMSLAATISVVSVLVAIVGVRRALVRARARARASAGQHRPAPQNQAVAQHHQAV